MLNFILGLSFLWLYNIAGNAEEADLLVKNTNQLFDHHSCELKVVIADSKYDAVKNYKYIRGKAAISIIDYNVRNEDLKKESLIKRGYDQNGWPFAPCGLLCRPNGFDYKRKRLTSCCFKQCLNLKCKALGILKNRHDIAICSYLNNQTGFVRHMYVKDHPRLVNEIPRGSVRYKNIKKLCLSTLSSATKFMKLALQLGILHQLLKHQQRMRMMLGLLLLLSVDVQSEFDLQTHHLLIFLRLIQQ